MDKAIQQLRSFADSTNADRVWFREQARLTRNHGMYIDAAACAIREKAIRDCIKIVTKEKSR